MARTSKSFRFPPATIERLGWLKSRYSSETATLILAIDRLYEHERSTMDTDRIEVMWTEETLWGSTDPTEYDQAQSEGNYTQSIINYIYDEHPAAEIDVAKGDVERVAVNDQTDTDKAEDIRLLIDTVWNGDTWLVAKSAPEYHYWDLLASGETYAIRIEDGTVTSCVGPLAYDEIDPANIELHEYDDQDWLDDAENLNPADYRLHVPGGVVYP